MRLPRESGQLTLYFSLDVPMRALAALRSFGPVIVFDRLYHFKHAPPALFQVMVF